MIWFLRLLSLGKITSIIKPILKVLLILVLILGFVQLGGLDLLPVSMSGPIGLASANTPDSTATNSLDNGDIVFQQENATNTTNTNNSTVWDEKVHSHSNEVNLYGVEFEGNTAVVYIHYNGDGEPPKVQVTDATRQYTGQVPKTTKTLDEGRNIIRVSMSNPSIKAVTIDVSGGSMFLYHEPPKTNWTPDVPQIPIIFSLIYVSVVGMIVGVELFNRRDNKTIEKEL